MSLYNYLKKYSISFTFGMLAITDSLKRESNFLLMQKIAQHLDAFEGLLIGRIFDFMSLFLKTYNNQLSGACIELTGRH